MLRNFFIFYAFAVVAILVIFGFRGQTFERPPIEIFPDMDHQSKYKPQAESRFFADGRTDRPVVSGTLPRIAEDPERRGLLTDDYLRTGIKDGRYGSGFPIQINREVMDRGRDRYMIYCYSCHGGLGDGNGITKEYGMIATPTFHSERIREMDEGMIFETITHGRGTMMPYRAKLSVEERWAVIAYVRALQNARLGSPDDVPGDKREELGL